jgi:hypothetical protein
LRRTLFAPLALSVAVALSRAATGGAKVLLSADEALALAFPGCAIERGTTYLTAAEVARASELAGTEVPSAVVHPYRARAGERICGTAWFDSHRVRTLAETVMVAIDGEGRIARVEVLSFDEPLDYQPRAAWYERFAGRPLDAELEPGRGLPPVTGATLTVRATTDAARRALALERVIGERATARPAAGQAAGETPP